MTSNPEHEERYGKSKVVEISAKKLIHHEVLDVPTHMYGN